jgi:hypothetical protein
MTIGDRIRTARTTPPTTSHPGRNLPSGHARAARPRMANAAAISATGSVHHHSDSTSDSRNATPVNMRPATVRTRASDSPSTRAISRAPTT